MEREFLRYLQENLPEDLDYHSVNHVKDVIKAAEVIGLNENCTEEEIVLLKTAALFHDAGFLRQYENNEEIGAEIAGEWMERYGFEPKQIETVQRLILATKVPHQVQDKLEKIICDADLDYLGRDDFFEIGDKLKIELMKRKIIKNDLEWDELQVNFLKQHVYFTNYLLTNRNPQKLEHLEMIEERLKRRKKRKANS
jgi:predicted metal-dependent HD superfamily phosphohydrolase